MTRCASADSLTDTGIKNIYILKSFYIYNFLDIIQHILKCKMYVYLRQLC